MDAVALAANRNAVAGAAIAIVVAVALAHVAALPRRRLSARYQTRERLVASFGGAVTSLLLVGGCGAVAGALWGPSPPEPDDLDEFFRSLGQALAIVFVGPLLVAGALFAVVLWLESRAVLTDPAPRVVLPLVSHVLLTVVAVSNWTSGGSPRHQDARWSAYLGGAALAAGAAAVAYGVLARRALLARRERRLAHRPRG